MGAYKFSAVLCANLLYLNFKVSLAPVFGYDAAAKLSKRAWPEGKTVRELAREEGVLSDEKLNELLDPEIMV